MFFIHSKFACKCINISLLKCTRKISALFAVLSINTKVKDIQKSDTTVLNMMSKLVIVWNFHALKGLCQVKLGPRFCFDKEKPVKVLKMKHYHDYLSSIPMGIFFPFFPLFFLKKHWPTVFIMQESHCCADHCWPTRT